MRKGPPKVKSHIVFDIFEFCILISISSETIYWSWAERQYEKNIISNTRHRHHP